MDTKLFILISLAFALIMMFIHGCLYIVGRKKYAFLWFLSWVFNAAAYLGMYGEFKSGDLLFYNIVQFVFFTAFFCVLFKGTMDFIGHKLSTVWLFLCMFAIAGEHAWCLFPNGYYPAASGFFPGIMLIYAGLASIRTAYVKSVVRHVMGCSFIMWGICTGLTFFGSEISAFFVQIIPTITGLTAIIAVINLQAAYFQSIHENQTAVDAELRRLIMYDKLTGIYNRGYFEIESQQLDIEKNLPISIILGDLNGLKLINDTFGHKKGDQLLASTARIIEAACPNGMIARWGGDEFIMLLPRTGFEEANTVLQVIKEGCRQFKDGSIPLDISLGVGTKENRSQDMQDIINLADERLYKNKLKESKLFRESIIRLLEDMLRKKDIETEEHVLRMKEMAGKIGRYLGLSGKEVKDLALAAFLHDIGKIAVPDSIINKRGPLTPDEWEIMKKHSETGYRITLASGEFTHISEAVLCHHEQWDGNGYPQGLQGDEIPLFSRIIAVVDAFDAMTHDRPYKPALGIPAALDEIERCAGTQFDPSIARLFVKIIKEDLSAQTA